MPTVRRGRTYRNYGDNDARGLGGVCSVFLIIALLVVPPAVLYDSERMRRVRYVALSDALHNGGREIYELNDPVGISRAASGTGRAPHAAAMVPPPPPPGALVHGTSSNVRASPADVDMGVMMPHTLLLRRSSEYCQWQEIRSQKCETCSRTVKAKDGSSREESYQCDCVSRYDYVKGWRSHRINSLLFDQPGAHHNPMRDPMPTRTFADDRATLTFRRGGGDDGDDDDNDDGDDDDNDDGAMSSRAILDPKMLSSGVRGWPYRNVEFNIDGMPPSPSYVARFLSFLGLSNLWRDNTRYETLSLLRNTPNSIAATDHNFVYVGRGGYFFSPYRGASTYGKLFNYFVQYLEGSLFDWQVGDIMPSCTAGDLRFRYEVQDPDVISVLGQLDADYDRVRVDGTTIGIVPREMSTSGRNDAWVGGDGASAIGLVHAGAKSARDMLVDEDDDSRYRANAVRLVLLLAWSMPASRLGGVAVGRELGMSSSSTQIAGAIGLYATLLGVMWLYIWGNAHGPIVSAFTLFVGLLACHRAYRTSYVVGGVGRRWHAVWCRIARWANAPPAWRVEDTYVGGFDPSMSGGNGTTGDAGGDDKAGRSKKL